ncbi:CGNR zinc finger domain-containing protein [Hamadaea sp. NPDC051192]|uniref:CGNR zinc finger domain-containing protein n=1 Tax=Hamadaea sp. NPDC051192 TaxID=3154940 RepID=UPI00343D6583
MLFTHDTEVSLAGAAALVNTVDADGVSDEKLPDEAALDEFFVAYRWSGGRTHTRVELQAVRDLRPRLRHMWELAIAERTEDFVDIINAMLRETNALPQLVKHDNWDYHLHATPSDAPLADRMAVEAAMAFIDVVRTGELGRLRICEYQNCGDVYVDLSKNRSKRFCDGGCGNRAAVSAYRARKAAAASS